MAQGGVVMDKSPSPPRIEWPDNNANLSETVNGSLAEHLQQIIVRKSLTGSSDTSDIYRASSTRSPDIKMLIKERDDMWREHARQQIAFVQEEHSKMLKMLHEEIERLQLKCANLTQQLADKDAITERETIRAVSSAKIEQLENKLKSTRSDLTQLHDLADQKELKIISLEQRWNELEQHYKSELLLRNQKIKDISTDLAQKSSTVAQLTNQLHQLRLKEAVERQKNEQQLRQLTDQQPPVRFLRANGTIVPAANSVIIGSPFQVHPTNGGGDDDATTKDGHFYARPPGNAPRRQRPGFRVGRVITVESPVSDDKSRASILPPISASSTTNTSLISLPAMNIEKPASKNASVNKQAMITTKTTFRTSLKRAPPTNDENQK